MRGLFRLTIVLIIPVLLAMLLGSAPVEKDKYGFPFQFRPAVLSGTFGELRSNHFHSGIDVKTGGEVGKPIYATRDGYVYRIKVSAYGFGKALYLRHPDGEFTVYAHLDHFVPTYEEYAYQKQYASKQFEQEIYPQVDEFPVKKGELIGYSGNSGSSQGPHLHFEIRDPEERITNPLLYYRDLISDTKAPTVGTVAFEPLGPESRVNGNFEKLEITPTGAPGRYEVPGIIEVQGPVGMEYHAWDLLDAAGNHCGVNGADLYLDNQLIFRLDLDKYSFDDKKNINVHFDFQHFLQTGRRFQRAYLEDGNSFPCYHDLVNQGRIDLQDNAVHPVRLVLKDAYGNATEIRAKVQRVGKGLSSPVSLTGTTTLRSYVRRNVLVVKVRNFRDTHFDGVDVTWDNDLTEKVAPTYRDGTDLVYLIPLGKWRFPKRVADPLSGKSLDFHFRKTVYPEKNNVVEMGDLQLYFPIGTVFDTMALPVEVSPRKNGMYSDVYEIGTHEIPLFKSFVVSIKPSIPAKSHQLVVAMLNKYGNWVYLGQDVREDGSVYASSGEFGKFCLMVDSIPPTVRPGNFKEGGTITGNTISVKLSDNFAGIVSEKNVMMLDGNWILGEFDAKTSTMTYRMRTRPSAGSHKLTVIAWDAANNMAEVEFSIKF